MYFHNYPTISMTMTSLDAKSNAAGGGPRFGLYASRKEGAHNTYSEHMGEGHRQLGFTHCQDGLTRYLGCPMGTDRFVAEKAKDTATKLVRSTKLLHLIDDYHLEFCLLRHCYSTVINHLARSVPPEVQEIRFTRKTKEWGLNSTRARAG